MFCQKCGAYNAEDARNCGSCGASINERKITKTQVQSQTIAQGRPVEQGQQTAQQNAGQPKQYVAAGNMPHYAAQPIKEYFVQAVLVTLLCNSIFGAVALVFSVLTGAAIKAGEHVKAEYYSQKTKLFCWISLWLGIATIILVFLWVFFVILSIGMSLSHDPYPFYY